MSKLRRIDRYEFDFLLEMLIEYHSDRDEPIPKNYNIEKVESSLSQPFFVIFGRQMYSGFLKKSAVLFYLFCKNHCLENGNKRVAIGVLSWFCYINNRKLEMSENQLHELSLHVAQSDATKMHDTLNFIVTVLGPHIIPE